MAFKYKRGLNHSPDWYEARSTHEPRGGPLIGALKRDLRLIGVEYDSSLTFTENVGRYREFFELAKKGEVLDGKRFDQTANLCYDVVYRETMADFRPEDQFKGEPFSTISELMLNHGINAETVRHFLKWRSRQRDVQQREKAIRDEREASYKKTAVLLSRFRQKKIIKPKATQPTKFFGDEGEENLPIGGDESAGHDTARL
jgi:hypothetical protein